MAILTGRGATEDRAGVIEIASDAEAFAGADVDRAITPDQLLAVVGQGVAAVAGGLIYKGTFDASTQQPDLSLALQGHFYKIEVAGQAFGQSFSVGDMLLINADMGGVIDAAKIDKIDNGESLAQLDDLADVRIVNEAQGQVLRYDGAEWINETISADDLASDHLAVHYTGAAAQSLLIHLQGIDLELNNRADTVNSIAVVNGSVTIGSDDIIGERTGVNYTGENTDSITTHLSGIDSDLGALDNKIDALTINSLTDVSLTGTLSTGEVIRYDGAEWVDSRLSSDDVDSDHTGVNYTQANATVTGQLSGIDSEINNRADTVNAIAVVNGSVTIASDDIVGEHTGVNYTAANTDSITTHLSGMDAKLGSLDGVIAALDLDDLTSVSLTGTLSDGEVLRYDGNEWLDSRLSSDDIDSDHTGVNYTAADDLITTHLSGIDSELNNRADTVNAIAVVNGSVTIGSDDIVGERAGTNYTALATDSITTHLSGIDSDLGTLDSKIDALRTDDITADHTGVNYTGADTDSITTHLSGIDSELGSLDNKIDNLGLNPLVDVTISGTLTNGETLRYDGNEWVDSRLSSDDIDSDHTGVNYTQTDATVTGQLEGIDTQLGSVATSINNIQAQGNNIALDADDLPSDLLAVNYTGLAADSVKTHLSGIDSELGTIDTRIDNLSLNPLADVTISGTLSDGEVLRYSADDSQWVDSRLDSDDVDSAHTGVNYTQANATVTGHLSGIDSELNDRADTVNSIAVVNGSVTIGSDDIVGERAGTNYTALITDTITTHLSGIDTELGSLDTAVTSLDLDDLASVSLTGTLSSGEVLRYNGAAWEDAQLDYSDLANTPTIPSDSDDLTAIHTGVNYTGANTDTITTHLSAIDNKIGTLEGAGSVDDVSAALTLVRGRLYQATNTLDVTHTLPASANSEEGDKIRVYRSQSAGLVTIQQDAGDAGTIIQTAEGFVSSFVLNLQGEYVEVIYDSDDSVWRTVQQRAAYIESTITTASDPYTVPRPNALYELDANGAARINVTLPPYSRLKNGDSFRFVVNTDREVEINVAGADSGVVGLVQAGVNNNDQIVLNALEGQPFEIKCLTSGGSDEFIVESLLGTASKFDVGTAATNIVQLDATGKLPAIDGSQLTNIAGGGGGGGGFNFDRQAVNFTATVNYHYSVSTATTAVVMTLPDLSAVGNSDQVRIYFRERVGTNDITINVAAASGDLINGSASFTLDVQYESITLIANTTDSIWEVI